MVMLRLDPPIPLLTPHGRGHAHFITDLGVEMDHQWTVLIDQGAKMGEWWTFQNKEVRGEPNRTLGRTKDDTADNQTPADKQASDEAYDSLEAARREAYRSF